MKFPSIKYLPWILLVLIIISVGGIFGVKWYQNKKSVKAPAVIEQKDIYLNFANEIYNIIQQNYWDKITDDQLSELYRLAVQKIQGGEISLLFKNKSGVESMIQNQLAKLPDTEKKKTFVTQVADLVLTNLQPFGRSRLYSQKLVQDLSNAVNNIDTSTNLYTDLGVAKNADQKTIEKVYQEKAAELSKQNTEEAKQKLALVERAHEALKAPERRQTYDQSGQEPTVTYRQLDSETFYVKLARFTPTLIPEFQAAAKIMDSKPAILRILVLDLRGNIGGAIDQLPSFLGPFIGIDQYAFEYLRRGERFPFKTITGFLPELMRYKKVVILTDGATQSSAEVMAGSLKKFNVGLLVGTPTKGWGTIERVFPITAQIDSKEIYAVYLVHTLTLADDNQPIEGRGVLPVINVTEKNWAQQFNYYFDNPALLEQVKKLFK